MSDAAIDTLPGIGPVTQSRLEDLGIRTVGDLRSMGLVEAYRRLKFMLPRQVSFNALHSTGPKSGAHFWGSSDAPFPKQRIVRREKPKPLFRTMRYALEAALRGCHWLDLPQDVKAALQEQAKITDEAFRRGGAARCAL